MAQEAEGEGVRALVEEQDEPLNPFTGFEALAHDKLAGTREPC